MTWIDFRFNSLGGSLPTQIGQLSAVTTLLVQGNSISGIIPTELGLLTNMAGYLYLGQNSFQGQIPATLAQLTRLNNLQARVGGLSPPPARLLADGVWAAQFALLFPKRLSLSCNALATTNRIPLNGPFFLPPSPLVSNPSPPACRCPPPLPAARSKICRSWLVPFRSTLESFRSSRR